MTVFDEQTTAILLRSRRYTRWLLIALSVLFSFVYFFAFLVVVGLEFNKLASLKTPIAATMFIVLSLELVVALLAVLLARTGEPVQNNRLLAAGLISIIGGIWLDVLATIANSPNLAQEGNLFIVILQEFRLPIMFLYGLGFAAQLGITVISCCIWIAWLRHCDIYKTCVLGMEPKNVLQLLYVSIGGNLTTAKTHPQRRMLSRSYRIFWIIGLWNITPFTRWLLGLEWMGIVAPGAWRMPVMVLEKILVVGLYFGWLVYAYYSRELTLNQPAEDRIVFTGVEEK